MNKKLLLSLLFLSGIVSLMNGSDEPPTKKRKIDETQMLQEELASNPQALIDAIKDEDFEKAKQYIEAGANMAVVYKDGVTPLHATAQACNFELTDLILNRSPNIVNFKDKNGWTPLHYTVNSLIHGCDSQTIINIVKLLITKGADINAKIEKANYEFNNSMDKGSTALTFVVDANNPNFAEIRKKDESQIKIARLLLEAGADVNILDNHDNTLLFYAIANRDLAMIELLLQAGLDPNISEKSEIVDYLPLGWAAYANFIEAIQLLLTYGANIDGQDINGQTALHLAVEEKNLDAVELLVKNGADIQIKNQANETPYDLAKELDWNDGLNELIVGAIDTDTLKKLSQKFDISVQDMRGDTVLHKLVNRYIKIQDTDPRIVKDELLDGVQELIGKAMSINKRLIDIRNDEGYTPLQLSIAAPRLYEKLLSIIKDPNE